MPTFELVLLFKQMKTPALKSALKRSAGHVFDSGATLRKMTNLGFQDMPFSINSKGVKHHMAHYFVFDYESGMEVPVKLKEIFLLDSDVLRATSVMQASTVFSLHLPRPERECTMHLDLLPPPYRPNIIKLQEKARKKAERKLKHKNYEDREFKFF